MKKITKKIKPKTPLKNVKSDLDNSLDCSCDSGNCDCKPNIFKKAFFGLLILVIGFFVVSKALDYQAMQDAKTKKIPQILKKLINSDKVTFEIEKIVENDGVYQFQMKLKADGQEQPYTSYMTKSGKLFFTTGLEVDKLNLEKDTTKTTETKKKTCSDLSKSETPKLTAFVVSKCPYGLQMQRLFKKASADLAGIADYLDIRYIGEIVDGKITSMHGDEEAQENLRQICLREEQKQVFYNYLTCHIQEGKVDECLVSVGANTANLNSCMTDANRGIKYAKADFDLANKFSVSGSPTLLLNNKETVSEFDFGGRNVKAVKDMLCCSGADKLSFCANNNASTEDIATSFSVSDVKDANSTNTAASCN